MKNNILKELSGKGYWPAVAMEYFNEQKYSSAVELCKMRLKENPEIMSGWLILARALYHSGQFEAAEQYFYNILKRDPENLAALKYLGDIKFRRGDEITALSYYEKVQQKDQSTNCLFSSLNVKQITETKVLTLKKGVDRELSNSAGLRELPFKTETIGDLLLSQGHHRLAMEVFRELAETGEPRLVDKLRKIKETINKEKGKNV